MTDRDIAERIAAAFFGDAGNIGEATTQIAIVLRELREEAERQAESDREVLVPLARKAFEWRSLEARRIRYLSRGNIELGDVLRRKERNALRRFRYAVARSGGNSVEQLRRQVVADGMARQALEIVR